MAEELDGEFRRLGVVSSDASVNLSSSDDYDYPCNSCETTGDHVEAVGYCVECTQYLCVSCMKFHFKNKALKGHVLFHLSCRITKVSDVESGHNNQSQHEATDDQSSDSIDDIDDLTFLKSVNVKTGSDNYDCIIVDIVVLSKNTLAVADFNNNCVRIIDSTADIVKNTERLTNSPLSMTRIAHDRLAVTLLDDKQFNILSTECGLNVIKSIRVDGQCYGIVHFNRKLLVSFKDPLMLEIFDLKGNVLEKIVPGQDVTSLCKLPRYIAISPDENTIYISDSENKICLSVDMKGKKLAECMELSEPAGIVCSPKLPYIIVCDQDKNVVRKLTLDLQCGDTLLDESDGLLSPNALCFCPQQRYVITSTAMLFPKHMNKIRIHQY